MSEYVCLCLCKGVYACVCLCQGVCACVYVRARVCVPVSLVRKPSPFQQGK